MVTYERGRITIQKLHLDSALLNSQRQSLIDYFLDLDENDFHREIEDYLDESGSELAEFFTMIEYLHSSGQL